MLSAILKYGQDRSGATAIEYGLIAAGISLAIVGAVFLLGDSLQLLFETMLPALAAIPAEVETGR